jgi:hypothetical protein
MARTAGRTTRSPRSQGLDRDPAASAPAGRACYLYGVVRDTRPLSVGPIGIDARWPDVYMIAFGDIAAVASDVPGAALDPTRDRVLAHDRVNHAVMRDRTVIPMGFGTVCRSREDVVRLLRAAHAAFCDVLWKVEGRVEIRTQVASRSRCHGRQPAPGHAERWRAAAARASAISATGCSGCVTYRWPRASTRRSGIA